MSISLLLLLLGLAWLFVYIKKALNFCHMVYIYNIYIPPKTVNPAVVEKYKDL